MNSGLMFFVAGRLFANMCKHSVLFEIFPHPLFSKSFLKSSFILKKFKNLDKFSIESCQHQSTLTLRLNHNIEAHSALRPVIHQN